MDFIQGHVPDVMVLLFLYTPIKMLVRNTTHAFIFARVFLSVSEVITSTKKKNSDINDMITTPRKAFSSETNLVHCLICAESLENTDRIAVFGRSQWDLRGDLRGTISRILGGELQPTKQGSQYVCTKKCFPKLKKVEKLSSTPRLFETSLEPKFQRRPQCASSRE